MSQLNSISADFTDRAMDVVEQTLLAADWACERSEEGMIHCASMTKWGEFGGMFAWRDEPASLNFSLTLDLRAPNAKQSAISELLRKIKAAQYVASHPGEVCPAKWEEGEKTLAPSLDLVGKI